MGANPASKQKSGIAGEPARSYDRDSTEPSKSRDEARPDWLTGLLQQTGLVDDQHPYALTFIDGLCSTLGDTRMEQTSRIGGPAIILRDLTAERLQDAIEVVTPLENLWRALAQRARVAAGDDRDRLLLLLALLGTMRPEIAGESGGVARLRKDTCSPEAFDLITEIDEGGRDKRGVVSRVRELLGLGIRGAHLRAGELLVPPLGRDIEDGDARPTAEPAKQTAKPEPPSRWTGTTTPMAAAALKLEYGSGKALCEFLRRVPCDHWLYELRKDGPARDSAGRLRKEAVEWVVENRLELEG